MFFHCTHQVAKYHWGNAAVTQVCCRRHVTPHPSRQVHQDGAAACSNLAFGVRTGDGAVSVTGRCTILASTRSCTYTTAKMVEGATHNMHGLVDVLPTKCLAMLQDNFYTLTVYEKGAEIVRLYNTLLGKEGFRRAPACQASSLQRCLCAGCAVCEDSGLTHGECSWVQEGHGPVLQAP